MLLFAFAVIRNSSLVCTGSVKMPNPQKEARTTFSFNSTKIKFRPLIRIRNQVDRKYVLAYTQNLNNNILHLTFLLKKRLT